MSEHLSFNGALLREASVLLKEKNPDNALKKLKLVNLSPSIRTQAEFIRYHLAMGEYYKQKHQYKNAIAVYEKIKSSHNIELLSLELGELYKQIGEFDNEALTYLQYLAEHDSQKITSALLNANVSKGRHEEIGIFFLKKMKWEEAVIVFNKTGNERFILTALLKKDYTSFDDSIRINAICKKNLDQCIDNIKNEKYSSALKKLTYFEKLLIDRHPELSCMFSQHKMICLEKLQRYEEAVSLGEKIQPFYRSVIENERFRACLGRCYEATEQFEKAFSIFNTAFDAIRILTKMGKIREAQSRANELRDLASRSKAHAVIEEFKNYKLSSVKPASVLDSLTERMDALRISAAASSEPSTASSSSSSSQPLLITRSPIKPRHKPVDISRKAHPKPPAIDHEGFITPKRQHGKRRRGGGIG